MHVHTYTHTHACTHTCKHIHTCMHTHMQTHTHTCTYLKGANEGTVPTDVGHDAFDDLVVVEEGDLIAYFKRVLHVC